MWKSAFADVVYPMSLRTKQSALAKTHLHHYTYAGRILWKSHTSKSFLVQIRAKLPGHLRTARAQQRSMHHLFWFPASPWSTHRQADSKLRIKNDAATRQRTGCCSAKVCSKQNHLQHCSHCNQIVLLWISTSPVFRVKEKKTQHLNEI